MQPHFLIITASSVYRMISMENGPVDPDNIQGGHRHIQVASSETYAPVSMDLAHRGLTPDFTQYVDYVSGGGMNYCVVSCDIIYTWYVFTYNL